MNDLGLDSLDHVEIVVALENEFGIFINFINKNLSLIFSFQVLKFLMLIMINYIQFNQLLII